MGAAEQDGTEIRYVVAGHDAAHDGAGELAAVAGLLPDLADGFRTAISRRRFRPIRG